MNPTDANLSTDSRVLFRHRTWCRGSFQQQHPPGRHLRAHGQAIEIGARRYPLAGSSRPFQATVWVPAVRTSSSSNRTRRPNTGPDYPRRRTRGSWQFRSSSGSRLGAGAKTGRHAGHGQYPAGIHSVQWDAREYASGVYFYRIQAGKNVQTRSMTLLK